VFSEIKICTGYSIDGAPVKNFPADVKTLDRITCEYITLEGWNCSLDGIASFDALPAAAQRYVETVERLLETPITWVSTSPAREDTFLR
jgi:adenylosuccinate synthase